MAMRRKTNRRTKRLKNRAQGLKSSHFTRKGTKQVYGKGPQGRKSFPHGILTSEDNYGGYQVYSDGMICDCGGGTGWSADIEGDIGGANSFVGLFQSCMAEDCSPSMVA